MKKWHFYLIICVVVLNGTFTMMVRAAAIGQPIEIMFPWFGFIEVSTGFLAAVLEAFVIGIAAYTWRQLEPGSLYWRVVGIAGGALLLMIPTTVTPVLATHHFEGSISEVLTFGMIIGNFLTWLWLFSIPLMPAIMAALVGICAALAKEEHTNIVVPETQTDARIIVFEAMTKVGKNPIQISRETGLPAIEVHSILEQLMVSQVTSGAE